MVTTKYIVSGFRAVQRVHKPIKAKKNLGSPSLHGHFDSQLDTAEIKHSQWCRKEIDSAHKDLVAASTNTLPPAVRNKRYVETGLLLTYSRTSFRIIGHSARAT